VVAVGALVVGVAAATAVRGLAGGPDGSVPDGVLHGGGPDAIAGSYTVILRESAARTPAEVTSAAHDLAGRHGGTVDHVYPSAVRGFSVLISARDVRRLAADPAVAHVAQNRTVGKTDVQSAPPWGLDRVDASVGTTLDNAYRYALTGRGVTVYVLDSGVRTTHRDFAGRARHGWDFVDGDGDASDCDGHGTHVAGTVAGGATGVAKQATVVAVRVLGCDGTGTSAEAIAGVDWVLRHATPPAVAVVGFTGVGVDFLVNFAVRASIDAGTTYVVAAGNAGDSACGYSPGNLDSAITVAATTDTDARATYSNHGGCVDLFAPGSDVASLDAGDDTATATRSGTSMAAAHVAGAAALVLQENPGYAPAQVAGAILDGATRGVVTDDRRTPNLLLHAPPSG
jgi:subtilisin family serine protease